MPKVKVIIDHAEVGKQLLRSGGIRAKCVGVAEQIAHRAGIGYGTKSYMAGTRAVAIAYPETGAAQAHNLATNALLRAARGNYDND